MKAFRSLFRGFRRSRRNHNLLFTSDNIGIDREIVYNGDGASAYVEVWFDAEEKFGIKLCGDDSVNVYAYLPSHSGDVQVSYIIHRASGRVEKERIYTALTQEEKELIRKMADEVSLEETGMTVNDNWLSFVHGGCPDNTGFEGVIA